MKTIKIGIILFGSLLMQPLTAQKSTETISKELGFSSNSSENMLVVQNVNGPIHVEGYDGKTIKIEIEKEISAKSDNKLAEGKREIQVKFEEIGNRIFVYLESPLNQYNTALERYECQKNDGVWQQPKYRYHLAFKLKIPRKTSVKLATMNQGDIYGKDIQGDEIDVRNLNGAITLENIAGKTNVNALNKDITITYFKNPTGDSNYHSLNGDVNVTFKGELNADVSFKSLNGDLFTNYDTTTLKPELVKKKSKNGKGVKYNMSSNQSYRIGSGGIKLDFNLLNGDATLKK